MILDHSMYKEGRILFLSIVPDIWDQEAPSSSLRGLSLGHELTRVDLLEPRNEPSLYVRKGRCHVLVDIEVSTSGFGIEFQSKTLRLTGVPGLTVICWVPVESVGGWSKGDETGHTKVETESGDGRRPWLTDGLSCRLEGTSREPSEVCISHCKIGGSGETTVISDALP